MHFLEAEKVLFQSTLSLSAWDGETGRRQHQKYPYTSNIKVLPAASAGWGVMR